MTNPSHILIARNSRSPNHSQSSSISSPEVETAPASGIFRSSGSPPWHIEETSSTEISDLEFASSEELEEVDIDETFTKCAKWPGNVKIIVENTSFWAHKDVLLFASPFFEAALGGDWSETGRPLSMSSVLTISQPRVGSDPADRSNLEPLEGITFAPAPDSDISDFDDLDDIDETSDGKASPISTADESTLIGDDEAKKKRARDGSLEKLQGQASKHKGKEKDRDKGKEKEKEKETIVKDKALLQSGKPHRSRTSRVPEGIIVLKEEKASTFHDFLKFIYPHLDCTITWNNVEGLMNISHKLVVPSLQKACLDFLLTHAAGRPIKAMRIAELFDEEELYKESSRFVLDNPGGWSDSEIQTLSQESLLKLEKRRNWFLERVLKLGLTNIAKEYQCCSTCPDPPTCARLLDEKWKQAYQTVFRFGPCQPSMVYRFLRTLEGVNPPLLLTHLACQTTAKAFIATLFDRMFSLGVRGSGTDTTTPRVPGAATGPRRHFLYCSLRPEIVTRVKRP